MQLLTLEPGGHVWLIAQSTAASAIKAAAVSSACFLLQVEAALIALAVIKQQLRNVALTRGLRLVANNWARLGGWGVRLLWGQKPPPLMQPLLELGSMAQREMEQLVANNWARLGGWGVRLLWGQKLPPLMQPLLELGSMAQREMEQ
ncbi:hypothetical protein OEZ86_001105 [Tetradesmus obliquus]|nr:hypothetical protein OEZ86_001105 [Tetradesmus obliquus]